MSNNVNGRSVFSAAVMALVGTGPNNSGYRPITADDRKRAVPTQYVTLCDALLASAETMRGVDDQSVATLRRLALEQRNRGLDYVRRIERDAKTAAAHSKRADKIRAAAKKLGMTLVPVTK